MTEVASQVIATPEQVTSDIGGGLFENLIGDLAPPPPAAAAPDGTLADNFTKPPEAKPDDKPADPPPAVKPADSPPAKPDTGLSPRDLMDRKADALPADLVKDEDVDTLFKGKDKEKNAFLKERAFNKKLREDLQAATTRLEQVSVDAEAKAEAERLRGEYEKSQAKIKDLEENLGKIDLTRSPAFRQQYDDRINQIGQRAVQTLIKEGVDQNEAVEFVRNVLKETKPTARERLIDDVAPGLKGTLLSLATQADEVVDARAAALDKWRETASALEESESRSRVAALTGKVDEVTATAVDEVRKLGNPYFVEVAGDDEWNATVAERVKQVKGLLLTGDFARIAPIVAEGVTASDLRARYVALRTKLQATEAELSEVLRGAPRLGERQPPPNKTGEQKPKIDFGAGSFEDVVAADLMPPVRR